MDDDIFSQLSDVETLTIKATALADLAMWIEQARTLIDRIRELTERDSAIAERFTANGIRYMSPEWDDDTSSGMTFLMLAQRAQIADRAACGLLACRRGIVGTRGCQMSGGVPSA